MECEGPVEQPQKIVIGKTWAYVFVLFLAALFIYLYREHQKPPKVYKEPNSI